jgi:hypothetical protein
VECFYVNAECIYTEYCYSDSCVCKAPSFLFIMLCVVLLNVIMLNAASLSVVAHSERVAQ